MLPDLQCCGEAVDDTVSQAEREDNAALDACLTAPEGHLPEETQHIIFRCRFLTLVAYRHAQAVREGDDAALDACLTAPVGHAAIRTAAAALAPGAAEAALAAAYARFRRRPGRGAQPTVWMRALLASHAGHLQSSRGAGTFGCCVGV